ncbi:MAG: hypothetical protein IKJ86_06860 [Clostridia bacterium]|nr:hypothetical protein [Clostridia bacterium]
MSKRKIVALEEPAIKLTKEEKGELEKEMLLSIYRSLYKTEKISFEQLKYLEKLNRKYW